MNHVIEAQKQHFRDVIFKSFKKAKKTTRFIVFNWDTEEEKECLKYSLESLAKDGHLSFSINSFSAKVSLTNSGKTKISKSSKWES